MELRDILLIDIESLSAVQAGQIANDAITVLAKGGLTGPEQDQLKTLLIAAQEMATGRKVGDSQDTVHQEVLQKIEEAEGRGDKRTARYLAESMVAADVAAADLAEQDPMGAINNYIENDIAASEAVRHKKQQEMIAARTQDLLYAHGWSRTEEELREQATREIIGRPAYEDDINIKPKRPDPQAILDAHKAAL